MELEYQFGKGNFNFFYIKIFSIRFSPRVLSVRPTKYISLSRSKIENVKVVSRFKRSAIQLIVVLNFKDDKDFL